MPTISNFLTWICAKWIKIYSVSLDDKQQSAVVKKITLLVSQDRVTDADKPSDKENQTEIFRYLDISPNQF